MFPWSYKRGEALTPKKQSKDKLKKERRLSNLNPANLGLKMERRQSEQVLSNAMNNFWKPEPPMEISEATAMPLSGVVSDAVKRWFDDTNRDAQRGDVKQQALLGQMLNEGYGCEKDQVAAAEWTDRAKKRGYKMDGVYCKL